MLVFAHPHPTPLLLEPTLLVGPAQTPALALSLPGCPRITVLAPPQLQAASLNHSLAGGVVILLISYLTVKHLMGLCLVAWETPEALSIVTVCSLVEYGFLEWFHLWAMEGQAGLLPQVFPGGSWGQSLPVGRDLG